MDFSSTVGLLVSLLLTYGVGFAMLWFLTGRPRAATAWIWGAAYPCGATVVTVSMVLLGLLQVPLQRVPLGLVAGMILATFGCRRRRSLPVPTLAAPPIAVPRLPGWLEVLLATLVASKVAFVVFDLVRRPVTAWDSFAVWALRAKVWAARGALVLDASDPFFLGGGARIDYPPHVSLLQTWTAVWMGGWHDVLVNIPWGMYYLSALAFLFGLLLAPLGRGWALAATTALAGLPLFVVHAAVAGYADMILAVQFLIAAGLLWVWSSDRRGAVLGAAIFAVLSLPWVKLEGVPLALACALVIGLQSARTRRFWVVAAVAVATGTAVALSNDALRAYLSSTAFRPQALRPVFDGLMRRGNWHLLWVIFAIVAAMRARVLWRSPTGWLLVNVGLPVVLLFYVLLFTGAAKFALLQTADSRLFLALAPAALLFAVLGLAEACASEEAA